MLDCKQFLECLSKHFDGELDEALLAEFEAHIEGCENARVMVETFDVTIKLHQRNSATPLPNDVRERLHTAIKCCMEEED